MLRWKSAKQNKLKITKLHGVGVCAGMFLGAFLLAFLVAPDLLLVHDSMADGVLASGSVLELALSADTLALSSSAADGNGFVADNVAAGVTSTASAGYNLYMSAAGRDKDGVHTASLVNANDKKYTIGTLPSSGDGSTIDLSFTTADGVRTYANTSSFTNNKWAYSVQDLTGKTDSEISSLSGTSTFKAIPLDETVINTNSNITGDTAGATTAIDTLSSETAGGAASTRASSIYAKNTASGAANDGSTPDNIEVTIATRTDNTIPAGDYTNILVFTAIGIDYEGTIIYDANGGNGDMSAADHGSISAGDSVTLYAPNYWRTGYGFAGWSEDQDAATKLANGQSVTVYGPNETITAPDTIAREDMTLYAVWIASAGDMQGWTGCPSMDIGDITALKDTRDNNVYAIAKLKDNKCWVIENYRLASGTVDSTNTNNPASGFAWTASSNSWCTANNSTCNDKVTLNTNNINPDLIASPTTDNDSSSWYSYGTYYNWHTATIGRGTYSIDSGNTAGDICPLGWHLPTSGNPGDFQAMYTAIGAVPANARKYPNNFITSGHWHGHPALYRGSIGYYWSSTVINTAYAYRSRIDDSSFDPSGRDNKFYGLSVRCIANTPTASAGTIVYNSNGGSGDMSMVTHTGVSNNANVQLYAPNYWRSGYGFLGWSTDPQAESKIGTVSAATIYGPQETITAPSDIATNGIVLYAIWKKSEGNMQDWKGCSSMSIGDVTALTDTRDNDTYAVAKLADNKCWQLENMRIHSGTVNSSNTHNPIPGFAWATNNNSWCTSVSSACYDQVLINTNNVNPGLTASPTTNNTSSSWYSYGVLYNWYAATAGRGTYSVSSGNAAGDICPFGWHLTTGASGGEFQVLYSALNSTPANARKYPNNIVLAGVLMSSTMELRSNRGYYQSSTVLNNETSYYLYIERNTFNALDYSGKSKTRGFAVRCIAG